MTKVINWTIIPSTIVKKYLPFLATSESGCKYLLVEIQYHL